MNWMRYKNIYFLLSATLIAVGIFSLAKWGLRLGVDFSGGTIAEYKFDREISTEQTAEKIKESGIDVYSIQETDDNTYLIKMPPVNSEDRVNIAETLNKL